MNVFRNIVFVIITLLAIPVYGQQGFNKGYALNGGTTVITDALYANGYIYASGVFTDTTAPIRDVHGLFKIDQQGSIVDTVYKKLPYNYFYTQKKLMYMGGDRIVSPGAFSSRHALLLDYRSDSLYQYHQFSDTTVQVYAITDVVFHSDSCYYLAMSKQDYSYDTDVALLKLNSNFEKVWEKEYGVNLYSEPPSCIHSMSDGSLLFGAVKSNFNHDPPGSDEYYPTWLVRIDTAGTVLDEWTNPDVDSHKPRQIIEAPDGSIIYCGAHVSYRSLGEPYIVNYVQKLTGDLQSEWGTELNSIATHFSLQDIKIYNSLIYVVGSEVDTTYTHVEDVTNQHYYGVLYILDMTGNVQYKRYYALPQSLQQLPNVHSPYFKLYSIDCIGDSSLILSGEAVVSFSPYNPTIPGQYGWLIKTDMYGCITNPCENVYTSAPEPYMGESIEVLVFPNPTSNYLQLEVPSTMLSAKFTISDINGSIQQQGIIEAFITGFDVRYYTSGVYIIRVEKNNSQKSVKFIKR